MENSAASSFHEGRKSFPPTYCVSVSVDFKRGAFAFLKVFGVGGARGRCVLGIHWNVFVLRHFSL